MDKYYVYRPLLDLIMEFEGTKIGLRPKARGYNTTLDYDAYTGGPVDLVKMTLAQLDTLQGRMLAHPKNKWNSSAAGAYQIVRKTRRGIEAKLKLDKSSLYDEDMQDRMACYLMGVRGIDKWLAGRMSMDTLLTNLSAEWASFPKPDGKGTYAGQGVGGKVGEVKAALEEVKRRHLEGQPAKETVPPKVEKEVKKETNLWGYLLSIFGSAGAVIQWLRDQDIGGIVAFGGIGLCGVLILTFLGPRLARSIKQIREELRS